jgi:hypothetical protein
MGTDCKIFEPLLGCFLALLLQRKTFFSAFNFPTFFVSFITLFICLLFLWENKIIEAIEFGTKASQGYF